jgi:hypothetical protein
VKPNSRPNRVHGDTRMSLTAVKFTTFRNGCLASFVA